MWKLNLSDWASLGEIVGAIAVVISLLYLGLQVSRNTRETRAANRQQLVNRAHLGAMRVSTDSELAELFAKAADGAGLTKRESMQYSYAVRAVLYDVQEAYLLHQEGGLDEGYWDTRAASILAYMRQEMAREVYLQHKSLGTLHVDFVRWLDSAMRERQAS
jgi:hypothetical protein